MNCIALWCNILDLAVEYVPLHAVDFGTQHHDTRFLLQNLDTYITSFGPFSRCLYATTTVTDFSVSRRMMNYDLI